MNCPNCDRKIPADSQYCIYCAARVNPAPEVATKPATGSTQRLGPAYNMPAPAGPAPLPASAPKQPPRHAARSHPRPFPLAAVWLIGLGLLFLTGTLWPGILVLVGLSSFAKDTARGKRDSGLSKLIFFSGLALLFATNWFWPGILLLMGAMWLLNGRNGRGWSC